MIRSRGIFLLGALVLLFSSRLSAQDEMEGVFYQVETGVENRAVLLGDEVNSKASDFGPIISADGNRLFFTSDRPGGFGGQDFWVSDRFRGRWTRARNLGPPVNTPEDEGPDSFSIFEDVLYFTACNRADGYGACDLYMTRETEKGWGEPENLGPRINTEYNEANASISSHGELLIFASDRPGGLGDYDLWMSNRKRSRLGFKRWSKAENLGPNVNTSQWEGVGFLHSDNKTLYFSSTGRGGFGKADIFRTRLEHGKWTEARNMGQIINTPRDDIYFTLPGSGELAYFSSNMRGGMGQEDIYSIEIPLLMPKKRFFLMQGSVTEKDTGKPLRARVEAWALGDEELIASGESSPEDGSYKLLVIGKPGEEEAEVNLRVNSKGYKALEQHIILVTDEKHLVVTRNFSLEPE
jgi:hypothetical protein